jgi:hypothetical protein
MLALQSSFGSVENGLLGLVLVIGSLLVEGAD